ncbi:MAG: hydroxymethylpyrimidine pyrophosphatase-like HAD family hydrolase [bacterium]|jgi:hydroxymethylpyrimidine pyrophosphatase-like HAD family hydrolase
MDTLLRTLLNSAACNCPHKTGKHIFKRPSTGAFSPLGDGATEEQRAEFIAWNQQSDFLAKSVEIIKQYYPKLDVQVFGKTTIDFSNKAMSKACVLSELRQFENKNIVFFGDNMQVGGNDRPLAEALLIESAKNMAITVKNPAETLQYLYNIKHNGAV